MQIGKEGSKMLFNDPPGLMKCKNGNSFKIVLRKHFVHNWIGYTLL